MNNRGVFDSDVLVDYLQGLVKAKEELDKYSKREISIVTWMEVMIGAETPEEESDCRKFLQGFKCHGVTPEIAEEAVRIRRAERIRLPDSIIWATSRIEGCILVTRNTKDFPADDPGIRFPYTVP